MSILHYVSSWNKLHSFSSLGSNIARRAISIGLMLCLLSSTTPAAPKTIVDWTKETRIGFKFWYASSGLVSWLQGPPKAVAKQETQRERDLKIGRVQIFPGDVTVQVGEHVNFTAVGYDSDDNAIGGAKVKWRTKRTEGKGHLRVTQQGEIEATAEGTFTVEAQIENRSAEVTVVVRGGVRRDLKEKPSQTRKVSTRDLPPEAMASVKKKKRDSRSRERATKKNADELVAKKNAHAPAPMLPDIGWDPGNYWSSDDPGNQTGNTPGAPADGGAGSGNFQLGAPVVSLAGRRINVTLGLAYNSRVWNKAGNQLNYDNDRGWPAPGFNMGFGKMFGIGVYTGALLIDADGTRHSYSGSVQIFNWGTIGTMHTTDGSFIDYTYTTGTNGIMLWGQAKLANGTIVNYGATGPGGLYATSIQEPNGNFVTITYVNNSGPRIQTVTDTLGRTINFHYNGNNLLTAVTAPGYEGGAARTLIRLHYHQHSLNYSNYGFSSSVTASVRDAFPWVVDAIYYPATATGFWLNDSDSYSSYGMIRKVVEQRGMGFSASSLNDMGTVSQGQTSRIETYSYPSTPNYALTDAPTYSSMTEEWSRDGTNFDSATTSYEINENSNPRSIIVTYPNGTKSKQLSIYNPGQYNDGLTYYDETYVVAGQPLQSSTTYWQPGAYNGARPYRMEWTDEHGHVTATDFVYGSNYNQIAELKDYDYGGTALRRVTKTTYENSSVYTGRHILSLPLKIEVFASDGLTRVSRTDFVYDNQPLTAAPLVVQHDQAYNPHADAEGFCYYDYDWNDPDCNGGCWDYNCDGYCPQYYVCPYDYSTTYRGNLTQVTTYADAANSTGALTETRTYDVTGNMVTISNQTCCERTSFTYTTDTQYSIPQTTTRGSLSDPYTQIKTTSVIDFNTSLPKVTKDANDRPSQMTYSPTSLRPISSTAPTGARTDYAYDDGAMTITQTTYLSSGEGGGVAEQNVKYLNGRGQIRQEKALGAGGVWDYLDTVYNGMGQISQQTRPYRSGETPQWITALYDALGRTTRVTFPDGSVNESYYNEKDFDPNDGYTPVRPSAASSVPGETLLSRDAWGRERWERTDSSGRMVEVVEPDPNGNGSTATNGMASTYTRNTTGSITSIVQGDQTRSFKYDSLGRLMAQKLAEASATLNDAGNYVGSGTWSDVYTYDSRSNLATHTDARGVKRINNYGTDPLNRLQSVSWDTSGFGDTNYPILSAATISYQYRQKSGPTDVKDITQVEVITTAGVSTETYTYHPTEGRLTAKTLRLHSRWDYPFVTDYTYDSLDRVKDMLYPAEYGNGSARRLVHRDFDIAGRVSGVTFNSQAQASNIAYDADSQVTSLTAGTGMNQVVENYSYNAQTGLPEGQTLTRNGSTLLNLSYDYAGANGKRTGQLKKILNNIDHNKDRGYEYDALGRLKRATGGQNINWAQRYNYDRYGNRNNVFSHTAEQYVRNFYQVALVRQPTSNELSSALSTLQAAYAQGPSQFWSAMMNLGASVFTSAEYAARQQNDHNYVHDLYAAYLWREPDSGGWAFWEQICGQSGRNTVRAGFDWSVEFELHVGGTSPNSPPGGATVPGDGWASLPYSTTNNRVAVSGWYYDAAGNQTRVQSGAGWQRFQYDAANRLIHVKADDNVTVLATNTYGSSRERLISDEGGTRTYANYEGLTLLAEYTESGGATMPSWSKSYVYAGDRLLSTVTPTGGGGTAVNYNHPDQLGTRIVTNPSTGTQTEQVNLPFGTALTSESVGPATSRRFTSYIRSTQTGLDYAYNRTYDSAQGRFTQVDPAGMNASNLSNPQTFNMYAYCANDPINKMDPSGLGFFSFISKLFKTIHKILKWVAVAVAVAFVIVALIAGPITAIVLLLKIGTAILSKLGFIKAVPLAFTASGEAVGGGLTIGLTGKILTGLEALGTISSHLQAKGQGKGGGGATRKVPDYVEKFFKKYGKAFNKCLQEATKQDNTGKPSKAAKEIGTVTAQNAPDVDRSGTRAEIGGYGAMKDGDAQKGRFGTIRVAKDIEDRHSTGMNRTVSKEEILNRTLAHEMANNALLRTSVADKVVFGDKNIGPGIDGSEPDIWEVGARVEKCIFGNIFP